jgi:hypothetical protein
MMKTKQIILLILFVIATGYAGQVQFITPMEINLGQVEAGSVIKDVIRFVNTGDEAVTIRQIRTSCGCTTSEIGNKIIVPGDTATVEFKLNTRGFQGKVHKSITIEFENPDLRPQTIRLLADCINYLDYYPSYLAFTRLHVNPDTLLRQEIRLTNHFNKAVTIQSVQNDMEILKVRWPKTPVQPGESALIEVILNPSIPFRKSSRLIIQTNQSDLEPVRIAVYVHIEEKE